MQRTKKILPHRILYFIRKNQRHAPAGKQLLKIQGKFQKKVSDPAALSPGEIIAEVYTCIIR